ncbi:MAG: helix-turn-helix transcriptional regulator [Gemmatimonadota bacterium]|nr:helix-turn-helix transcriptional regulator [Gemmatimonadota bacterium]
MTERLEIRGLPRAFHEILVLAGLREGPKHGYQVALDIEERSGGAFEVGHGTLYPILHQMEEAGLIDGRWSREGGRRRKEYEITPAGQVHLEARTEAWRALQERLDRFVDATAA